MRLLSQGSASVEKAAAGEKFLLDAGEHGTISVEARTVMEMVSAGVVTRNRGCIVLSDAGLAASMRAQSGPDAFQDQHRDLASTSLDTDSGRSLATLNHAESPLAQLMRRKTKTGVGFLTSAEFDAGERLRADYTRGQIMPRLGANWEASVSSGRRNGGLADLTDAALSARQRVDAAIEAVGPELSGVLIDVCCFLKGMEVVEMERGWPVRSAKIVLKTALGVLGRHYNPAASTTARQQRQTLHWGTDDYRPNIG